MLAGTTLGNVTVNLITAYILWMSLKDIHFSGEILSNFPHNKLIVIVYDHTAKY